ncbi:MAG TPA: adenylosuccinate synthase [Thermomicrobiales bacterium]|nr:adenylosuccinate synthase [Thermomicrobiales bacterium]
MPATIILGGQWGDEGKGKLTDALAVEASMVVRANGGSNAGHTVQTDLGTFKFRLIPSGILNPDCACVIGAGVVIDLETLVGELTGLRDRGVDTTGMLISDRAHLVLPYHRMLDQLEEQRREQDEIGTTLNGNGPAYADKASRHGLRTCDLKRPDILRRKLAIEVDAKNQQLVRIFGESPIEFEPLYRNLVEWGEIIAPMIRSTEVIVQDCLGKDERVIVECAQGAMLDIDYGTYPYVTSSSPTAAGACQGAGVAPSQVDDVVGVYKAYSTRVGGGPMPAELTDDVGELIRQRGKEWGVNTGRPRRTGWFDAVAGRQSSRLNGVGSIALSLVDVLDVFEEIRICTGYILGGQTLTHIPALLEDLDDAEPEWIDMPGWQTDTTAIRASGELPPALRDYIEQIGTLLGAPVRYIGVGPAREQLIRLASPKEA